MSEPIKGILQVKKGDEYLPMYPTTTADQVKDFAESARRKTAPIYKLRSEFVESNPVVANGIWAIEKDTGRMKLGDGASTWSELEYVPMNAGALDNMTDAVRGQLTPIIRTEEQFATEDPVIPLNIKAICSDNGGMKIGNGTSRWSALDFVNINESQVVGLDDKIKSNVQIIRGERTDFAAMETPTKLNALYVDNVRGVKLGDGTSTWSELEFINGTQITLKVKQDDGSYVPV